MPKTKKTKHSSNYVPYARGFKPPSQQRQLSAIGFDGAVPPEYSISLNKSDFEFFQQIPKPTSIDDWLAQYDEDGQTYKQFISECPWLSTRKRKSLKQAFDPKGTNIHEKYPNGKVYLIPIGEFDGHHFSYFDELAKFSEIYLGIPVRTLPGIELMVHDKDKKVFWVEHPSDCDPIKNKRRSSRKKNTTLESRFNGQQYQLGIGDLLRMLRLKIPDDAICFIGLTMSDLFCDQTDLFVAGMAAGNHQVAIFSFYRYNPSLSFSQGDWYDVDQDDSLDPKYVRKIMFQRSCKLLVHEINHLLGIDHCIFFSCCMNGSGHLTEDYRQPMHLCPVDLHKLHTLVQFDILQRYKNLLEFYEKHDMTAESDWVSRRIKCIQSSQTGS